MAKRKVILARYVGNQDGYYIKDIDYEICLSIHHNGNFMIYSGDDFCRKNIRLYSCMEKLQDNWTDFKSIECRLPRSLVASCVS